MIVQPGTSIFNSYLPLKSPGVGNTHQFSESHDSHRMGFFFFCEGGFISWWIILYLFLTESLGLLPVNFQVNLNLK